MSATPDHPYRVVEGWEQLPRGFTHGDCVGVGVDAQDNVYLFTRRQSRVLVYSREGAFLRAWGEDLFTARTHGLTVGPDGRVYCVDEGNHCVYVFTPAGDLLTTIGTPGVPTATPSRSSAAPMPRVAGLTDGVAPASTRRQDCRRRGHGRHRAGRPAPRA
jgi:DNA-binding beta-propeller fold protein YncE